MNIAEEQLEENEVHRNLVLIGGRGCGKSSVSRRILFERKDFVVFSVDSLIRYEQAGLSIPEIVERIGWPGFRDVEFEVIRKLSGFGEGILVDCGGGCVVDLDERGDEIFSDRKVEALRRNACVIYLERDVDYLIDRISGDASRPALSETASFREIMARRDPWYRQAAHHTLDCRDRPKKWIVNAVLELYDASAAGS